MLCQTCQCLTLIVSLIFSISYISPMIQMYCKVLQFATRRHLFYLLNICDILHQNAFSVLLQLMSLYKSSLLGTSRHYAVIIESSKIYIWYLQIYRYINFILMSFYNMKNIAVKMLLIKLINQFSKLNRYYIIMYKQQRKNLLNSDRYFLIII